MKILSKIYTLLIFIFLYAPIIVLVIFSFNSTKSRAVFSGFTFKWYEKLFHNDQIISAAITTLKVAIIASVLAAILGTVAAVIIRYSSKRIGNLCTNLTNIPMLNPEIVTGVSLMLLFVFLSGVLRFFSMGLMSLILAHTIFCTPYVMLNVLPKLIQTDISLYEAAIDLGCTPFKAFFKIILPQIKVSVLTGIIMAFTMSFDDFVISYFTCGTVQTLSVEIYSMTRKIVSPEINALSTVMFATVMILLIIVNLRQLSENKKKGVG